MGFFGVVFCFFYKNRYRKVLLFISKAPQFRSHKTQSLNKSFNKAVQLTFLLPAQTSAAVGFVTHNLKVKKKKVLQILVTVFSFLCCCCFSVMINQLPSKGSFATNNLGFLWLNLKIMSSCQGLHRSVSADFALTVHCD